MAKEESYAVEVTVSVKVRAGAVGQNVVAEYSVTRRGETFGTPEKAGSTVERALVNATAAEKAFRAGLVNAEGRRLK